MVNKPLIRPYRLIFGGGILGGVGWLATMQAGVLELVVLYIAIFAPQHVAVVYIKIHGDW